MAQPNTSLLTPVYDFLVYRIAERVAHTDPATPLEEIRLNDEIVGTCSYGTIKFRNGVELCTFSGTCNVREIKRQMLASYLTQVFPDYSFPPVDGEMAALMKNAIYRCVDYAVKNRNNTDAYATVVLGGVYHLFTVRHGKYGLSIRDNDSGLTFCFGWRKDVPFELEDSSCLGDSIEKVFTPLAMYYSVKEVVPPVLEVQDETGRVIMDAYKHEPPADAKEETRLFEQKKTVDLWTASHVASVKPNNQWVKVDQGDYQALPKVPGMYRVRYREPDRLEMLGLDYFPVELIVRWDGGQWVSDFKQQVVEWYSECLVTRSN